MTTGAESEGDRDKRRRQRTLFDRIAERYEDSRPSYPARATFLSWSPGTQRHFTEELRRTLERHPVMHLTRHTSVTMAQVAEATAGGSGSAGT